MTLSTRSQNEVKGVAPFIDFATPATNKLKVQALIDALEPNATQDQRGNLDQMSPTARAHLLVEVEALFGAIVNV